MKKILEIYDISDDYRDYQGNPYMQCCLMYCHI